MPSTEAGMERMRVLLKMINNLIFEFSILIFHQTWRSPRVVSK